MSSPFKLLQKPINPTSLLCRGCLAESGEMKNMYEWCINDDFVKFTEVQLNSMDNLSVLLCTKCEEMLQNCQTFRQQCQNSNLILNNMLKDEIKSSNIAYILTDKKLTYIISLSPNEIHPNLPCPYQCKKTFISKQLLTQHFIHEHNVNDLDIEVQYHCVIRECKFHVDSMSYFDDRNNLNKHYEYCNAKSGCEKCNEEYGFCKCNAVEKDRMIGRTEKEAKDKENSIESILLENQLILKITAPNTESKIYLPCPYNCRNRFFKKKDLLTHLRRLHNKDEQFLINLQYYCSHTNCIYHLKSVKEMFFTERKFLNQHYVKKHKSKDFICLDCTTDFSSENEYNRHKKYCNMPLVCEICSNEYKTHERWLVHIMRKHPQLHKKYKDAKKNKRSSITNSDSKKQKIENVNDFICDSPKRSFATQTNASLNIRNDVTLPSWLSTVNTKKDEISTQTGFEDILSLKSQNSEDESLFCSETVSLTDIQTQTPFEFGLSGLDTVKDIKETQTCVCLYESPKNFRIFEGLQSSPSIKMSTETQTADLGCPFTLNNIETQTCFDEGL